MEWAPGTRVGPYEVIDTLGAGGMGQVFRARDTRLRREVAIKVLPAIFADDHERLRRFESEARIVGMLNHPNILAVYDIGTFENMPYLVTELLTGETLRQRIDRGALPERQAVAFARQVAQGLALAHEKGVVHRDLKPDNLFWTTEDSAKILDFGLAKFSTPIEGGGLSIAGRATEAGTVLGTAGYMAPEQVQGKPADPRSDIFSLGAILYEMVSGRKAFEAETTVEIMVRVMRHEPASLPEASLALDQVIRHCLAKDPDHRFQSARDLSFALQACGASGSTMAFSQTGIPPIPPAGKTPAFRRMLPWAALASVALLALGLLAGHYIWRPTIAQPVFHDISFRRGAIFSGRFTPDGQVVYSARWEDQPIQIFSVQRQYPDSRPVSSASTMLLSLSSGGQMAILKDARYLHHLEWSGTLAVMNQGGTPRDLIDNVEGADWDPTSEDTGRMAVARPENGKMILEFPIGHTIYSTAGWISHIRVSPKGGIVAFLDHPVVNDSLGNVAVVDSEGTKKTLSTGWSAESGLAWSPDGKEVWFSAAQAGTALNIYAVTLDGRMREAMVGPGRMLLEDVSRDGRLLVSRDNVRTMMTGSTAGERDWHELSWLDHSHGPYFSTDGKQVLFTEGGKAAGPRYALCLRRTNGSGGVVRLGDGVALGLSPDDKWALAAVPGPPGQLTVVPIGAGQPRALERGALETYGGAGAWLPDGKHVIFTAYERGKPVRVFVQAIAGGPPRPVLPAGYSAVFRAISPDGHSVACRAGGIYRICPLDSPGGNLKDGDAPPIPGMEDGEQPLRWTPDGQSLYVCDTSKLPLRIAKLETATGKRQPWKEITPPDISGLASQMVAIISADGQSLVYGYSRVLSELFIVDPQAF